MFLYKERLLIPYLCFTVLECNFRNVGEELQEKIYRLVGEQSLGVAAAHQQFSVLLDPLSVLIMRVTIDWSLIRVSYVRQQYNL